MGKDINDTTRIQSVSGMNEKVLDSYTPEIVLFEEKRKRIYHYTSMNTFFKILKDVGNDLFVFRAGSLYTMNDRQEMMLGYEYIKKCLPKIEEELKVKGDEKISNITAKHNDNETILNNFGDWLKNNDTTNFIVSFSTASDILPMWALYGERGTGVCMEFSPYIIKNYYADNNIDKRMEIEECKYNQKDIEEFMLWRLGTIYKQYLGKGVDDRKKSITKAEYLSVMCGVVGAFVKHPAFEYEKEIRMNVFKHKRNWKFDDYSHKPYIEIPIPIHALTGVIVGPAANLDLINSMILCLRAKGLSIEPKKSGIPFRL